LIAVPMISGAVLLQSSALAAAASGSDVIPSEVASVPRVSSPLVAAVDSLPSSDPLPVVLDPALLALAVDAAASAPGIVIEDVPVAPGASRSIVVTRVVPSPSLMVEVVDRDAGGNFVVRRFTADEIDAAFGVIFVGSVEGSPESSAILSIGPAGTFGLMDDGPSRFVISSGPTGSGNPVLAFDANALAPGVMPTAEWFCGAESLAVDDASSDEGGAAESPFPCRQFSVAVDTDHEYLQLLGGSPLAAANYAVLLLAAGTEITTAGPNVRLGLTYLRLWATADDPWTQTSASPQLYQFRTTWNATMGTIVRDVAHFLSGRALGGGVAWTATLCTDKSFSLSSNLNGSFPYPLQSNLPQNWDVIVVTHEIAHNLGALHTHQYGINSPDLCGMGECFAAAQGTIMSYCYICPGGIANIALSFAPISTTTIVAYLTSAICLPPPPIADLVAVDDFVAAVNGATITIDLLGNDLAANCDAISLAAVDESSVAGGTVETAGAQMPVKYKPPPGFVGQDSFSYSIVGSGAPAVGQVFVWVTGPVADLNGDGVVNGVDLNLLLASWSTANSMADLSGDGVVNGIDLAIMLSHWTM